jgi:MFS family permease
MTLSMFLFGLSRSFSALVVSRSLVGLLNGNIGVLKSIMGEITDDTNAAQGLALIPIVWSTGSTIGYVLPCPQDYPCINNSASFSFSPLIGGVLARPAETWERFNWGLWREFPYFLPCATAAAISLTAFFAGFLWLKEVSVMKGFRRRAPDSGRISDRTDGTEETTNYKVQGASQIRPFRIYTTTG